ncbi:CAP Gly-rich domain-containing protein [Flagelloscypha sp. PMI_526]|nr:CAP Gly-rich domain-containing protein [Flagelloscypha sp. PMI_526]
MSEYVGKRVSVRDDLGTICYYGPVDGASGLWLGIDWDIPERGKHDGSKDGKRYFSSRFPSSGSFLRLSPQVQFGRPFIVALLDKYVESYHGSQPESVILGSSNGSIQVEAVNLDKIRAKFSNVGRLKEISLHGELVSFAGEQPDEIKETCASVRGLDLSKNLLADWGVISQITTHIPTLLRLSLNQNRLATLSEQVIPLMRNGFPHLQELQLNGTLINWSEMQCLTAYMPTLHSIELGYNQLHTVSGDQPPPQLAPLSSVNFDSNSLKDWVNVIGAIRQYTNVERLVLSSNCIDYIPNLHDDMVAVGHIKHLILAHNRLSDWECVDNLSTWCPNLESASFIGNPFLVDPEILKVARSLIVAKIPSLVALDGTAISPQERNDSELYYLSYITAHQHPRLQDTHPQWARLRKSKSRFRISIAPSSCLTRHQTPPLYPIASRTWIRE